LERAIARELCQMIVSDCQPIQNLKVLTKIGNDFGQEHKMPWGKFWIEDALKAFEKKLETTAGKFCVGDEVTLADVCLVPQIYNANRFGVDMKQFPRINAVAENCNSLKYFKDAHPDNQPDTQK
jgi:maleylacetoacetate isomerase